MYYWVGPKLGAGLRFMVRELILRSTFVKKDGGIRTGTNKTINFVIKLNELGALVSRKDLRRRTNRTPKR